MIEKHLDTTSRFVHNRFYMAEGSHPEGGMVRLPPNKDLRYHSMEKRRGFLGKVAKALAGLGILGGSAYGVNKAAEHGIKKVERVGRFDGYKDQK